MRLGAYVRRPHTNPLHCSLSLFSDAIELSWSFPSLDHGCFMWLPSCLCPVQSSPTSNLNGLFPACDFSRWLRLRERPELSRAKSDVHQAPDVSDGPSCVTLLKSFVRIGLDTRLSGDFSSVGPPTFLSPTYFDYPGRGTISPRGGLDNSPPALRVPKSHGGTLFLAGSVFVRVAASSMPRYVSLSPLRPKKSSMVWHVRYPGKEEALHDALMKDAYSSSPDSPPLPPTP